MGISNTPRRIAGTRSCSGSLEAVVRLEPIAWTHSFNGQKRIGYTEDLLALPDDTPLYVIPEGWTLVPKEPTPEMITAGLEIESGIVCEDGLNNGYRAMLAAAPTPN